MLIVAGFLVLYHILAIIAGTAHEGRLGGKVMNQILAPIRLVMAIGLLVPIGVNGLNSGQMIVLYVSKWGSALASNIWMNFATTFATQTGLFIIAPPLPQVSPTLKEALKIMTCAAGYNDLGVKSNGDFDILVQGWYSSGPNIKKSWDWQNNLSSKDIETVACGSVELPDPAYAAGGKSFAFFGTDTVLTASQQLRQDLLTAHRDALDDLMTIGSATAPKCAAGGGSTGGTVTGGLIYQLANKIYWSADSGNTCYVLTQADLELFNDAVTDYRTAISGATSAALGVGGLDAAAMAADAAVRGWLSAGVWFNTIARVNGLLIDYAQEVPVTKPNFKTLVDTVYANTIINAMESVDASIASLSVLASVSGTAMAETGFYVATGGGGAGNSVLDIYLKTLAGNFAYILGNMTNSPWESATGSSASAFMLNTANPLAELTTLGFRIIDLAMRTSNAVNQCVNEVNNEANALKSEGSGLTGNEYGFNSSCLGASYIGTVPTETLLMQAAIGSMISGGVTLAFLLPLLPFIRFMFGILSWVLSLFETVIAIPVVALAHIKPDGEGLSGPLARTAYLLLLQLFLRPTLMIFGLVLALVLFNLMVLALNEFYTMAVRGVENSGKLGAISAVVYTVIYAAMAYALANASFKAIDLVPNQTLQWIGGPNGQTIDESQRISGVLSQATGIAHHGLSGMGAKAALGGPKAV